MNPTIGGVISILGFSICTLLIIWAEKIPPFQFCAISLFTGFTTITIFQLYLGKFDLKIWKQPFKTYATVFLGIGVYNFLITTAFNTAPAFGVNVLNYTWPVLWVVFSAIDIRQKPAFFKIVGVVLSFIGIILVFSSKAEGSIPSFGWDEGYLLAIAAAVAWALYSVRSKKLDYPSYFLAPIMLCAALCSLVLHLIFEETIYEAPLVNWLSVIVFGMLYIVYVLWDYCIKKGNTLILSSLAYFTPLLSMCWFILAGFTPANILVALAAVLIVLGCLITNADRIMRAFEKINKGRDAAL